MPTGSVIVEFWGGLHDGKRQTVRGKASSLPVTVTIEEVAPIAATPRGPGDPPAKPQRPAKLRYTYELETRQGRVYYRYRGQELVNP